MIHTELMGNVGNLGSKKKQSLDRLFCPPILLEGHLRIIRAVLQAATKKCSLNSNGCWRKVVWTFGIMGFLWNHCVIVNEYKHTVLV